MKHKRSTSQYTVILLIIALFLLLSLTSETFLAYDNLYSVIYGVSIQFFAVIGFTLLIVMGEVDLAVGSMYGLSGTLVGYCICVWKWPLWLAIPVVLAACAAAGYLVGVIVTRFRLNSMMVTLGTTSLIAGLNAVVFNSFPAVTYSAEYRAIAKFKLFDIHWTIVLMAVIVIVLEFLLHRLPAMRKLYYIGNSGETARLYGIKTDKIKRICFTVSSLTAAIGGIVATSRITHSDILTGKNLEFTLITASVVGGASMAGGRGGILNAALGMIFIALLSNGMTIYRIDPFMQQIALGVILVVSVFADVHMNTRKRT